MLYLRRGSRDIPPRRPRFPKIICYEKYCRRGRSQSISGVNPLAAFYDIHGRKRELLFFYFVPETTRDSLLLLLLFHNVLRYSELHSEIFEGKVVKRRKYFYL
jgi:hypothetical protein